MRHRLWIAITALALMGCQTGGVPTPTMPVSPPPSSPTPSPSPTIEFTGDRLAAYQHVREYLDALYAWGQQPTGDLSSVTVYVTDDAEDTTVEMMRELIESGSRVSGRPSYSSWKISHPEPAPGGPLELGVTFCLDLNSVNSIDANGVERGLSRTSREKYQLRKLNDNSWSIFKMDNEDSPC